MPFNAFLYLEGSYLDLSNSRFVIVFSFISHWALDHVCPLRPLEQWWLKQPEHFAAK